jgi:hypothetical protein
MNEPSFSPETKSPASREEMFAALFANMIIQQSNMALMCLGKVPHPESGELMQDIESAKMLIDQLEMMEAKTKGNLDKREENLLKQALAAVRMAFVEVIDGPAAAPSPEPSLSSAAAPTVRTMNPPQPESTTEPAPDAPPSGSPPASSPADSESRKKFSKKY